MGDKFPFPPHKAAVCRVCCSLTSTSDRSAAWASSLSTATYSNALCQCCVRSTGMYSVLVSMQVPAFRGTTLLDRQAVYTGPMPTIGSLCQAARPPMSCDRNSFAVCHQDKHACHRGPDLEPRHLIGEKKHNRRSQ